MERKVVKVATTCTAQRTSITVKGELLHEAIGLEVDKFDQ